MYLTDFIFDGVKLSSLGYLVGSATTSNNETASAGSKLDLQTVMNRGNNINQIITAQYNEPITASFDIIKLTCGDSSEQIVSDREISYVMRWLNRTTYCKFKPIYNDSTFPDVFFNGTFIEISTIQMGGVVVGFSVTFIANTPYGYADYDNQQLNIMIPSGMETASKIYYDESDEYGIHYPEEFIVHLSTGGDLNLTNELSNKTTIVENCIDGEVLIFDCIHRIITSNKASQHTTLYKDFNYVFPSLCNTTETRENIFTSNISVEMSMTYKPIRKVGIVV